MGASFGTKISSLGSSVGGWFSDLGSNIGSWFGNTITAVTSVPDKILGGLKDLFVPSGSYFTDQFNDIKSKANSRIGIDVFTNSLNRLGGN